ncbi:hypothetical protein KNP414_02642 [Paenibacillus mucilaginosus KNP414]|uniref:Uncharacterized protein n=1 Tax=Paenibacillus mucilaginosus (strain KNP414) TaxID=1036673 RepID=F8F5N0_PAEMK|nr:hypothetical protein KNP414_02642 [Paenibacillus mucilaginosus KNP414]
MEMNRRNIIKPDLPFTIQQAKEPGGAARLFGLLEFPHPPLPLRRTGFLLQGPS